MWTNIREFRREQPVYGSRSQIVANKKLNRKKEHKWQWFTSFTI